jgi:hypothetical protein
MLTFTKCKKSHVLFIFKSCDTHQILVGYHGKRSTVAFPKTEMPTLVGKNMYGHRRRAYLLAAYLNEKVREEDPYGI